jgi:hypothetical protein
LALRLTAFARGARRTFRLATGLRFAFRAAALGLRDGFARFPAGLRAAGLALRGFRIAFRRRFFVRAMKCSVGVVRCGGMRAALVDLPR